MNDSRIAAYFSGKTVLVVGGAGSIGSSLCFALAEYAKVVRVLDSDENGLFVFKKAIPIGNKKFRLFLGDIKDKDRLDRAVEGADVVYHLAALKHVSLSHSNPFEVVKTNIVGTQNLLEAVLDAKTVSKFVFFSSDKAVNPKGVYGVSKLLGEQLVISASSYKGERPTKFCCVRLGNVIGTRGSVWSVWEKQFKKGGPLTVTDRNASRYFMTMERAIRFVLRATIRLGDGEIAVPKMKEFRIMDLAEQYGHRIRVTGIGKSEKLHEELMTADELKDAEEGGGMWIVREG